MQPPAHAQPGSCSLRGRDLLALTMVPGLGPVRIARLSEALGSPGAVLGASAAQLARVPGIGNVTAGRIAEHLNQASKGVEDELGEIARAGAHVLALGDPHYPPMLAAIPAAPPVLMVRGTLDHNGPHKYTVAIVGSRSCSVYGSEQAGRFAGALASAGLTVVSGGARGIDTGAHRGAMRAGGGTVVVLGCGIGQSYPPENAALFDEVVERGGAVVSELPTNAAPDAKNFPARNRIISGLSLGVLVIEAGRKSGALITARHAVDDHGREVMGVPGRVDSPASAGTHELLRSGAHLVSEPSDVLSILEGSALHLHAGTHAAITTDPARDPTHTPSREPSPQPASETPAARTRKRETGLPSAPDSASRTILEALTDPMTGDELSEATGLAPGRLRALLTSLEISGRVKRDGSRFVRAR